MPRKRRPTRTVRRPTFQPAPEPTTSDEDEEAQALAEEPAVTVPDYPATGLAETRVHRVSRTSRVQGRRLAQLRRSSGEDRGIARAVGPGQLPVYERAYITDEIRRILITTGALVAVLVALTVILR